MAFDQIKYDAWLKFVDEENARPCGYLKPWKATGIFWTIREIPEICKDKKRLYEYLYNCMTMEGFMPDAVQRATNFMFELYNPSLDSPE